jgi:ABC-type glycerol-3-phosphate transport system substrate-binding protein
MDVARGGGGWAVAVARRRTVLGGALAGVVPALWLAACGSSTDTQPAANQPKVDISLWSNLAPTHTETPPRKAAVDAFNAAQDRVRVSQEDDAAMSTAVSTQKALTAAAAGSPPDVMWNSYSQVATLFTSLATTDLNPLLKTDKAWPAQQKDIVPRMLESVLWKGKLTGVPIYTNGTLMAYPTTLFDGAVAAKIKPGWTWNDFLAVGATVTKPPDRYAVLIPRGSGTSNPITPYNTFNSWYGTTGGKVFSPDGTKVQINNDNARAAMQHLVDLVSRGLAPLVPPAGYSFANGNIVFDQPGPGSPAAYRKAGITQFGIVGFPVKSVRSSTCGGHTFTVFRGAARAKQEAATLMARWVNQASVQADMTVANAALLPVSNSARQLKPMQELAANDPALKVFLDELPYLDRPNSMPSGTQLYERLGVAVADILDGKIGINDGLGRAQQEMQLLLDADLKLNG